LKTVCSLLTLLLVSAVAFDHQQVENVSTQIEKQAMEEASPSQAA